MYVPKAFAADGESVAWDVMAEHDFALLIGSDLVATHLPVVADCEHRRLLCHVARANDHWQRLDGQRALIVFQGPHGYVSPRWYATSPAVPTWNYVAVHVTGAVRALHDEAALRDVLARLTRRYEGGGPWRMADQPESFMAGMLRGIVGLEIAIDKIETKFKLSQNRSREDRERVIAMLEATGRAADKDLATAMRRVMVASSG
jgi:transcriptional regulator